MESFYGKWFTTDDIHVILEVEDETKPSKTYEEIVKQIEDRIIASFVDHDVSEEYLPTNNLKQCIQSLKISYQVIKTCEKKMLYEHGRCGEILDKLKTFSPKKFVQLANKNGITYKLGYINALIQLSRLLQKHPTLLKASISFSYIRSNFKIIE